MLRCEPYKKKFWGIYDDDKLLCVTLYKKGALAVIARITAEPSFSLCHSCRNYHWTNGACEDFIERARMEEILALLDSTKRSLRDFFMCWCGVTAAPYTGRCETHFELAKE